MKIKFDSQQEYQLRAVQAVVDLFEGQSLNQSAFEISLGTGTGSLALNDKGLGNALELSKKQLLANVQRVQERNGISPSEALKPCVFDTGKVLSYGDIENDYSGIQKYDGKKRAAIPLNFTIEMETGTGKTYTYIRTIYELNKTYGFKKFVIVVPSVAIREGTLKNLEITASHFQALYNRPAIEHFVYDSSRISDLRSFASSNSIQVLVINIDSFTKDTNIINQVRETGIRPIEYLQASRPIVIVDEPQNMETEVRKRAIGNLNPLCTLRYSATHRNFYNLVYRLTPVDAYDLGLVKQIEVDSVVAEDDLNAPYIEFVKLKRTKNSIKAKVKLYKNDPKSHSVKVRTLTVKRGDDLYEKSNQREIYKDNFIINSINAEEESMTFSNGATIYKGHVQGGLTEEVMRYEIERTVKHHFEKARRLQARGIKVLSLFFIDKVENYRIYKGSETKKGKFAKWFEEAFAKYASKPEYSDLYPYKPSEVHNGYFSKDNKGKLKDTRGNTKADDTTYNLIMKDKERLLSLDEPLSFIFSHSALREGWDNPNVFQICTLNETKSDLKKRQEIGRGLRLPVDNNGYRSFDKNINVLTVIANETYKDFSEQLQREIEEETSVSFEGRIKDTRERRTVRLNKQLTPANFPLFFELWERINEQTRYEVKYDTSTLIKEAAKEIKEMPAIRRPMLRVGTYKLNYTEEGVDGIVKEQGLEAIEAKEVYVPDVYGYIQSKLQLTRSTIYQILKRSGRYEDVRINPQVFLDNVIGCIERVLNTLLVDGIKYERIQGKRYAMRLFEDAELEMYLSNLFEVGQNKEGEEKEAAINKTLYNYVPVDSDIERDFAKDCEADSKIRFYFKLPAKFKIPTPIGSYNPDWAVVFENDQRIYFVAETKGTLSKDQLRATERLKIDCGYKHFEQFAKEDVKYVQVVEKDDLYNYT